VTPSTSQFRAIGYAVLGFALWVATDSCVKWVGEAQLPPQEIVFFLSFFGMITIAAYACARRRPKHLWPNRPRAQIVRAALAFTTGIFNAIALKHLPLTLFYITVFTAPLMIALLAAVFLREKLTWQKIVAVVVGFVGVMIAIDPFRDIGHGSLIGFGAAFVSAVCFAVSVIWLRHITQSETSESLVFFGALFGAICGGVATLYHAEPVTLKLFPILVAMGVLCVGGNLAVYGALRSTTAANVSQFHYTQIIGGALLGYLIWNEIPTLNLLAGSVFIIASGLYIASHARKTDNLATLNPH